MSTLVGSYVLKSSPWIFDNVCMLVEVSIFFYSSVDTKKCTLQMVSVLTSLREQCIFVAWIILNFLWYNNTNLIKFQKQIMQFKHVVGILFMLTSWSVQTQPILSVTVICIYIAWIVLDFVLG